MGGQRLQIGSHLVADVARRGSPIGSDDTHVDLSVLHEVATDVIGNNGMRNPVTPELPCRQARPLIARTGFVDPNMNRQTVIEGLVNGGKRGSPVDRRQPTGIAVGQQVDRLAAAFPFPDIDDQFLPVIADGRTGRDIVVTNLRRAPISFGNALVARTIADAALHELQRPA